MKFKKGSYKLPAAAIVLAVAFSAILLTNASDNGKLAELDTPAPAASPNFEFSPVYNDLFRWFSSLDRALDFPKYNFKVPDYLPESYQLERVLYSKNFSKPNDTDLIDVASITFAANLGMENEQRIEVIASKGNGNLLEHNQLLGANYPQSANETPKFRQEAVTISNVKGTLFTDKRIYKDRPETGKSFYWHDDNVQYTLNYYSEDISQEELTKMVQSFVLPKQVQNVRYDGDGNSFPLYDEKDLLAAKNILGFKVKIPFEFPELHLSYSILLKAGDQNTSYAFRQATDALWTQYNAPHDSSIYDVSDYFSLYQSKEPLFDASKLSFKRKLEIHGVEISAYEDQDHVYFSLGKRAKLPIYLWKQDDIYYTAIFSGMDKYQEDNLKAIIAAPVQ
ncbi:DUF4367 domain-containing protein [Paenibacillus dakarensis]|uniref:DUF4367 domain-containing protein n=1 Tax=Paenibacillus dakarensis TaxID=1527293 RepID=UPI000ABB8732|nr:DUF4367 domain-containing protein [Paenibacillus dakarensis]